MPNVMLSPQARGRVVPDTNSDLAKSLQENQVPATVQPHFPSDTRQCRTQKSASREISPVMDHAHLEESGCDHTDASLLRESDRKEAETLMHLELPGGEQENAETDQDDVKQTETTNGSHHVHDLIEQFESKALNDKEEEADCISASRQDESDGIIGKIVGDIGTAVTKAGHTVVEGLKKVAHTIRYVLPKSETDEDQGTSNNIHVQHPNLTGNMVGLGMIIHKTNRGHHVQTVASGGLAHKAKIKSNDIIRQVNDNDVVNWEFEKLQEFFANQKTFVLKLVIERQNGVDENGQSLYVTFTVAIKLSFEDDRVVADIDVTYTAWPLGYSGNKPSELPEYLIYQEGAKTSKYLNLDTSFCGMTTQVTEHCCFKMYRYKPSLSSPRVLYNMGMSLPLDLGKKSRIGDDNGELTGSGISTANDKRFFYQWKKSHQYAFELISRRNYFLTVANDDSITETYFPGVNSVTSAGLFNTVEAPSSLKSDLTKANKLMQKQDKHLKSIY